MSETERKIRISVDADTASTRLNRIKEDALDLGRALAEEAAKRTSGARDFNRYILEEISLLERRNKLQSTDAKFAAQEKFESSRKTPKDREILQKELDKINAGDKNSSVQSEYLKQILQAILKQTKTEVLENKRAVQENIKSDREISEMSDKEAAIKATFQKKTLEELEGKKKTPQEKDRDRLNRIGSFVKSDNLYSMGYEGAGHILNKVGKESNNRIAGFLAITGGLVAAGAATAIRAAESELEGLGDLSRASGGFYSKKSLKKGFGDVGRLTGAASFEGLDLTDAEAYSRIAQISSSSGRRLNFKNNEASNLLKIERGTNIDASQLSSMALNTKESDATNIAGYLRAALRNNGLAMERTNELLSTSLSVQEGIFERTGSASPAATIGLIGSAMRAQQLSKQDTSPGRAANLLNKLNTLGEGSSNELDAMLYSLWVKENPNKSASQFYEDMEMGAQGSRLSLIKKATSNLNLDQKKLFYRGIGMGTIKDAKSAINFSLDQGRELGGWEYQRERAILAGTDEEKGVNTVKKSSAAVANTAAKGGEWALDKAKTLMQFLVSIQEATEGVKSFNESLQKKIERDAFNSFFTHPGKI